MIRCASLHRSTSLLALGLGLLMASSAAAAPIMVTVTIDNLAPANGNFLTPFWVGFQDGNFDLYDVAASASPGLERLAEDGNTGPLSGEFTASGAGLVQGTLPGPGGPIAPGQTASMNFMLDGALLTSRFFSYASMVIPSNDAFIANGDPLGHQIFDGAGNFLGADFLVLGTEVLDAGTEVNDEIPMNTAFFGQAAPDTGTSEGGTVQLHPGFILAGPILSDPMFANADFTLPGYQVARIRVTAVPAVPEPSTLVLWSLGTVALVGMGWQRRERGA